MQPLYFLKTGANNWGMQEQANNHPYFISSYCSIRHSLVRASHVALDTTEKFSDFAEYGKFIYNSLMLNYPKFFKMDNLSKLAFLTTEILLKEKQLSGYSPDKIGVVMGNSFATLETDLNYYDTILDKDNYFPSPSLFVYTLPNIMIGEICIRHKIKGENAFFVFKEFNHNFIQKYVTDLLHTGKIDCCITGWIDFRNSYYESVLFLVEAKSTSAKPLEYTAETTREIYSIEPFIP
jgi:hypothetical protein